MSVYVQLRMVHCHSPFQETLHSVGSWKQEMERYNVGPHRKHAVWIMAGHKKGNQDYSGMVAQAEVRENVLCTCTYSVHVHEQSST